MQPTKTVPVTGGVTLATYERGQGRTVIMISGLGASAADWGPLVDRLAERARVITIDNRGAGRSTMPDEPITLDLLADDVAAVFAAYGLASAHVIGTSMGGMIAQIFAARYPTHVERLVLMATHAGVKNALRPTPDARIGLLPEEAQLTREQIVRKRYAAYVAPRFLTERRESFEQMMRVRLANLLPEYAWQRQFQAVLASEREDLVRRIRAPTLIVHGREDPLIRFGNGERLRDLIPGAELVAIEDCGHMLSWERAEEVADVLTAFLRLSA